MRKAEVSTCFLVDSDEPFGGGNSGTERLSGRDASFGHHVVSRIKVLAFLRVSEASTHGRAQSIATADRQHLERGATCRCLWRAAFELLNVTVAHDLPC